MRVVPIYPPTTYMLVAPLTLPSWQWANLVLAILETLAVCIMSLSVVAIGRHDLRFDEAWLIVALVLAFASFHTAVHGANISVISTVLCALAVYLASHDSDLRAGILLGVATCLQPHPGIWLFAFYLLRRKWQLVVAGSVSGWLLPGGSFAGIGLPLNAVLSNYSANLHDWIRPGGQNDFGLANPIRFDLANFQIVLDPLLGRSAANAVAYGLAALGFVLWIYSVYRKPSVRRRWPPSLRHRHRDAGPGVDLRCSRRRFETHRAGPETQAHETDSLRLILLLLLPIPSVAIRAQSYRSPQAAQPWWWNSAIGPYTSWTPLAFGAVLPYALRVSAKTHELAPTPS